MARTTPIERYRNIGIMAHIDAGKTTTTERVLYLHRRATRSAKSTTARPPWTGWSRSRSAASRLRLLRPPVSGTTTGSNERINIIDTPGHVDFTIEVERSPARAGRRSCRADSIAGVEPQTETVWRQATSTACRACSSSTRWTAIGADFLRCRRNDHSSASAQTRS